MPSAFHCQYPPQLRTREQSFIDERRTASATTGRVPTTSVFSRSDGVVAWQACLHDEGTLCSENIEVASSHCGLAWNVRVLAIIAERLHQPEGAWRPYAPGDAATSRSTGVATGVNRLRTS